MDTSVTKLSLVVLICFFFIFDALNLDSKSPFKKASMSHQATCFPAEGMLGRAGEEGLAEGSVYVC